MGGTDSAPDEGLWTRGVRVHPGAFYRGLFYVAGAVLIVPFLIALYWLAVVAVTPPSRTYQLGLVPETVNPVNFLVALDRFAIHRYVLNSFVIAGTTTVIVLVLGSLAGYAFGRLEFQGRRPVMLTTLAIGYFPPAAFLIALFLLFTGNVGVFGLAPPSIYETTGAVIVPLSALTLPLSIFVLTSFYRQIPQGLEDAARVEGATRLGALWRVIVPHSAPGVATAAVLTFTQVYNEFFFSFLMTSTRPADGSPIAPAIHSIRETDATFASAASRGAAPGRVAGPVRERASGRGTECLDRRPWVTATVTVTA